MKLVSVEQMRRIEQASDAAGHTYAEMMDLAGAAVAQAIQSRVEVQGRRILVLVGPGNNGGDGLVAARELRAAGAEITCYLLKDRGEDPLVAAVRDAGGTIAAAPDDHQFRLLRRMARGADVIVDALLGTGTARPLEGDLAKILDIVRAESAARRQAPLAAPGPLVPLESRPAGAPAPLLVAVDGPTGLNYDTGDLDPAAVPADLTVTFAYPKPGHVRVPGGPACGQILVADIGAAPKLAADISIEVAGPDMIRSLLPPRPASAHKGTFGKAMIVAGSIYYSGAAALAAQSAGRIGAGLVTLAPPRSIYGVVAGKMTEVTYLPLPDDMGVLAAGAIKVLGEKIGGYDALLLGPGISTEKETVAFVRTLLGIDVPAKKAGFGFHAGADSESHTDQLKLPLLVVDADALNAMAEVEGWASRIPPQSILTPHPGEMARLMRLEGPAALDQDRIALAGRMATEWGHIVLLKGPYTAIAEPGGRTVVLPFANPALATAGSGDVLAGAIVGLLAQGLGPFDAAVCGAFLHGLAGEIARQQIGEAGVVAGDLISRLPQAIRLVRG